MRKLFQGAAAIAALGTSFTSYINQVSFSLLSDGFLQANLLSDFNETGCFSPLNITSNFSTATLPEGDATAAAVSLLFPTSDLVATLGSSPPYYMSMLFPENWNTEEEKQQVRAFFYAGIVYTPFVIASTFAGIYYLPNMLQSPVFGLNDEASCFFRALSQRAAWVMVPAGIKSWLEQFLFCGGLLHQTWVPSVAAVSIGFSLNFALSQSEMPYYYMWIPAGVEAAIVLSHVGTFLLADKIKKLQLSKPVSCNDIGKALGKILKGSVWYGLSLGVELIAPLVTSFLAASYGGTVSETILGAQQNFYVAYILQVASAVHMGIEVQPSNHKDASWQTIKDVMKSGGILCVPTILIMMLVNILTNSDPFQVSGAYVLGAAIGLSEFGRTGFVNAMRALGHDSAAFWITLLALASGSAAQSVFLDKMAEDADDKTVALTLLGLQLVSSATGLAVTASVLSCRLFGSSCKKRENDQQQSKGLSEILHTTKDSDDNGSVSSEPYSPLS
jgi:hypothetical protein